MSNRAVTVTGRNSRGLAIFSQEINGWYLLAGASRIYLQHLDVDDTDVDDIARNLADTRAEIARFVPGRAGRLFNRLEAPVLPRHRAVREAKARLAALGADAALMSGSGACVFGLCRGRAKAAAAASATAA